MKTVYQVLEEMLGEEQAGVVLASAQGLTITPSETSRIGALTYVMGILTVEEAGKMV